MKDIKARALAVVCEKLDAFAPDAVEAAVAVLVAEFEVTEAEAREEAEEAFAKVLDAYSKR